MYLNHFGLREEPFSLSSDTAYYVGLNGSQEALNVLTVALQNGNGLVKIVGEVGTGKTLLCRKLLHSLDDSYVSAILSNPMLPPPTNSITRLLTNSELGLRRMSTVFGCPSTSMTSWCG